MIKTVEKWKNYLADKIIQNGYTVKLVYNDHPLDPQKVAVVQIVAVVCRLLKLIRSVLYWLFVGWGSDRSLLTGGCCSEVVVSPGLTVNTFYCHQKGL